MDCGLVWSGGLCGPTAVPTASPTAAPTPAPAPMCLPGERSGNNSECVLCGSGRHSDTVNADSCIACAPGYCADNAAAIDCTICSAGAYQPPANLLCPNVDRAALQRNGLAALLLLLPPSNADDSGLASAKSRMLHAEPGAVEHCFRLMGLHVADREMMSSALRLLARLVDDDAGRSHVDVQSDSFGDFCNVAFEYRNEGAAARSGDSMRELLGRIVHFVARSDDARRPFPTIRSAISAASAPAQLAAACEPHLKRIGTYGLDKALAQVMVSADVNGVECVLQVVSNISATSAKFDGQLHALRVTLWALHELLSARPEMSDELLKQLVDTLLKIAANFPELVDEAARSLQLLATFPRAHKMLVDAGAIELCVALLKAHPVNARIGQMAGACLNSLARSPAGDAQSYAKLIARKGGTQEALAYCKRNGGARFLREQRQKDGEDDSDIDRSQFDGALCTLCDMLEAEVAYPDVAEVLKRQGAVESLVTTMLEYKRHEEVSKACARVLAPLVNLSDLTRDIPSFEQLGKNVAKASCRIPANTSSRIARLGRLARVGPPHQCAKDIVANGGAEALIKLCEEGAMRTRSPERTELIAACLDALADIAFFTDVSDLERLVPIVLAELNENRLSADQRVFDFLDTLARGAGAAAKLMALGGVAQLWDLLQEAAREGDGARLEALARALASLARQNPEAAAELAKLGATDFLTEWLKENAASGPGVFGAGTWSFVSTCAILAAN